jgi:hypothetical protein
VEFGLKGKGAASLETEELNLSVDLDATNAQCNKQCPIVVISQTKRLFRGQAGPNPIRMFQEYFFASILACLMHVVLKRIRKLRSY